VLGALLNLFFRKGDSQALVQMNFKNGKDAFYEGAKTNSIGLNCGGNECIRAECEKATKSQIYSKI